MSRSPLLLLPPSEGKTIGGRRAGRPDTFAGDLSRPRAAVVAELGRVLRSASGSTRAAVLGVRGELLERALVATGELLDGTAPVLPAWRRYSGVVWAGLDPGTVTPADRRRILVPSGLYGMTTAADPVADYRLKLLVSLGRLGRLSTFWRPMVTPALCRRARGRVVVDLLPAEHAHALDLTALASSTRVVQVRFVGADGRRAVGHEAKSAKGRLARAVL
ncbi:MAG TPA: peroxide stress protein YaaA, partial [Acidimicrobiales bacterium]